MFYPTHPSFSFPFSPLFLQPPVPVHSSVAKRKLNVVEAAPKMGVVKDTSCKSSPKVYLDEFCPSSSDYFFVDQLLNFSNEEDGFIEEEEEEKTKQSIISVSAPLQESDENSNHSSTNSSDDGFWSVSSRDFEDLEWLSHLVSDSSQEYSASAAVPPCSVSVFFPNNYQNETTHKFGSNFKTKFRFPSKPRSKRAKISGRVWSSSSTSLITSSPSAKKPKKNSKAEGAGRLQPPRRCSHCGVHKTPQWRAGPLGTKTLCNACGVRFKSGRLFPEYRPACSPSFSSELHSNHHRKVLEMRRQKETEKRPSGPDPSLGAV